MARKKTRRRTTPQAKPEAASPNAWDRLSGRARHLICSGLLVAVSLGFFAPIHFTEKSLIGGDTVKWRAMAEYMMAYRAETGEEPLWAPNAFAGMPGYFISPKTLVPQIDDIFSALRDVLWPTSHLVLLFLGTYLLVYFLTRNRLAGVLSAIGFGLTTYLPIILVAGHNSKYVALAFVPWLVLAFAYALRRPSVLAGLLFGVAVAANLRAGHIQPIYYISFLLGVWWIVEGVRAFRTQESRAFLQSTLWLAVGSILGLLMVAHPYLSQAESKAYTIRGMGTGGTEGALDWSHAMNWSQGIGELVTLLIAGAYGPGPETYWGPKPFTEGPHYVGGIILLLAGLAVWRLRPAVVTAFGISGLLMVLFSLGEHFPLLNRPMFLYFPLFDALRAPETWLSAAAFVLAVLAGFGIWFVVRREPTPEAERQKTRSVTIALGTAVGLVLVLLLFRSVFFDFERPDEYRQIEQQVLMQRPDLSPDDVQVQTFIRQHLAQIKEDRQEAFQSDAMRTLIFLLLAGGLLLLYRRGTVAAPILQAGLALLVLVDLWGVGRRYLHEDRLAPQPSLEAQIPRYPFDEFILERQEEAGGMGRFRVISFEGTSPTVNARPSYYHESLGGYHGAKLRLYQDYLDHILFDGGQPNKNALDLLNTRYVIAPVDLPGMQTVYQDERTGMRVLENPDAVPRAFFVGDVEVVNEPEAMWARLQNPSFDPQATALLSDPPDFPVAPLEDGASTSVEMQSYTPRRIEWRVATDAPRLLVVSEIYYPAGWKARLDGEEVPIVRTNYLLRGVPIPEGEHTLVMSFEPASHTIGVWISAIATVVTYGGVLLILGLAFVRRRRRDAQEAYSRTPQ